MKRSISAIPACLALCHTLTLASSAAAGNHSKARLDIVETAVSAGSFETLAAALAEAGLIEALQGDGPFTVFAPTDDAFAKLPAGTVENLLKPENLDRLREILTYHVVSGRVSSRQAVALDSAATLNGQKVGIAFENGRFEIGGAGIVSADVEASNGVIHVIDSVLLPPEKTPSRELIELAIERGVPLFNAGQQAACAAIYEVAANSLLGGFEGELTDDMRSRLRSALDDLRSTRDSGRQAWILRDALDDVYRSL